MAEGGIVGPGQTVCPHQNRPITTGANRCLSTGKPRLTLTLTLTLTRSARRPREYERRRRCRGARPTASSTSTGATTAGACPTVRWRARGCGAPPTPRRRTARKRPHPRSSAPASSERGCPLMPWLVHVLLLGLPVLVLRALVCLVGARVPLLAQCPCVLPPSIVWLFGI